MSVVLSLRYHDSEPAGGICKDDADAKAEAAKIAREVLNDLADPDELHCALDKVACDRETAGNPGPIPADVDELTDDEALEIAADLMQLEWMTLPGEDDKTDAERLGEIVGPYGDDVVSARALLETGACLAQRAADRWESGDLAGAVAALTEWAGDVRTAFPGLDYSDDEETDEDDDGEA